jgi:lycopene beta-cyclase
MKYDYIISGAGCAGLSLAVRMIQSEKFLDKKILIADRSLKSRNDRTWCFWEKEEGLFDPIVFRKWSTLYFHGESFDELLDIAPYQYKMIRGIDFYDYCLKIIRSASNFTLVEGKVEALQTRETTATVVVNGKTYEGDYVFNSILFDPPKEDRNWYFLKQHFKGWIIKTRKPVFDPVKATLMDFRPSQNHGTTFVYVLPFSDDTALIEYTLFTKDLLQQEEYNDALRNYISEHITTEDYDVTDEEFGLIPMTNYPFPPLNGRVANIGTAGGQTKPSSGYTFQFIQKYTKSLTDSIIATGQPQINTNTSNRFSFYDSTLLQILDKKRLEGKRVFTDLFRHGDVQTVLKFLDNETTFREDLGIMRRLPKGKFAMAALREIFK